MNEATFIHQASSWLGLLLGAVSLGLVIFNAGRWSGRMERAEKHLHDMKNSLQSYLPREIHTLAVQSIERQLADLTTEMKAANKVNRTLLIKLVGHGVDIED
jgi:hypothetical protein